ESLNQDGTLHEGVKASAVLIGPDQSAMNIALTEVSAGHHVGSTLINLAGDYSLRVAAEGLSAETPLHVAYPALYALNRANPGRLAFLAAATGGRMLAEPEQIFTDIERRWVKRDAWQIWTLTALALFLAGLVVRYGSGRRRGRHISATAH